MESVDSFYVRCERCLIKIFTSKHIVLLQNLYKLSIFLVAHSMLSISRCVLGTRKGHVFKTFSGGIALRPPLFCLHWNVFPTDV